MTSKRKFRLLAIVNTTVHPVEWQHEVAFRRGQSYGGPAIVQKTFSLAGFNFAGVTNRNRTVSTGPSTIPIEAAELYLKPGARERSKTKILKIVDFIEQIVEKDEEQPLLDNGTKKLFLKGCTKKPKLENLNLS